jgi:hypothetical protein
MLAAKNGHVRALEVLVTNGASVNENDRVRDIIHGMK